MPTYEDPLGKYDHLELKSFDQAKADFKGTLGRWGDINLRRHIQSAQARFATEADVRGRAKFEEAHHQLIQAAAQP